MDDVRKKAFCIRRSLRIIEAISHSAMNESFLKKALLFLDVENFEAAVEERNAALRCGHFVCYSPIQISTQKYRISRLDGRVYNLERRNKFCSNWCFEASEHLLHQILPSPAWCRQPDDYLLRIDFLPAEAESREGEIIAEVPLRYRLSMLEYQNRAEDLLPMEPVHSDEEDGASQNNKEYDDEDNHHHHHQPVKSSTALLTQAFVALRKDNAIPEETKLPAKVPPSVVCEADILDGVFHRLAGWFTQHSVDFLIQRRLQCCAEALARDGDVLSNSTMTKYQKKVLKFYGIPVDRWQQPPTEEEAREPVFPTLDAKNQNAIRQRLLFDRLSVNLKTLFAQQNIQKGNLESDLRNLLKTFQLTAVSASLKSIEWRPVAFCIYLLWQAEEQNVADLLERHRNTYTAFVGRDFDTFFHYFQRFYHQYVLKQPLEENEN